MIIISPSLVLSPTGAAPNADSPIVGWRNDLDIGSIVADSEQAGYPASNLGNPSTAEVWRSDTDAEQYITASVDNPDGVDYLAVARHNFGSAQIAVSVEGRAVVGVGSWVELTAPQLLANDRVVLFRFEEQFLAEIRLRMQAGDAEPYAAVIYVGKLLVLQRNIYVGHKPLSYNLSSRVTNGRSESGQFLGRIVTGQSSESSLDLQNITPAFFREEMVPWIEAAVDDPWFFAWRPGSYPAEVGFAYSTGDAQVTNQRSNGFMQVSLSMGGVL